MPQELCDVLKSTQIDSQGVEDFIDKVSEVSRLIDGLKAGTISPDYVDTKLSDKADGKAPKTAKDRHFSCHVKQQQDAEDAGGREAANQAELQRKVAELKANRERKGRVRQLYQQHTERLEEKYATDYTKWDLFCPSDDEDDLFNSITPSNQQFKAMEKDINDRHDRMVEQRQIAERQRQLGNDAFKAKQYSEALRCYELGLDSQKHSMTLHANAAMAALKLKCYVQAMEHCDKVLHLAEVLYDTPKHTLCVKALQRRATAYQALGQHNKAVDDLKKAAVILPGDKELCDQLERAERLLQEYKTAKKLKALAADAKTADAPDVCAVAANASISHLQEMEQLVAVVQSGSQSGGQNPPQTGEDVAGVCRKLKGLVQQEDSFRVYFRECGGFAAVIKQVLHATSPEVLSSALQLLAVACDNSTTLEQLAEQQNLLAAVLDQLSSPDSAVYAAAVELLYTASTAAVVRQELCKQLLARSRSAASGIATSRLCVVWTCCATPGTHPAGVQVQAISLLSNCLLVSSVREASQHLFSSNAALLGGLIDLLESASSSREAVKYALPQKLYGLLSNLSTHPATRRRLADHTQLVAVVLKAALSHAGPAPTSISTNCRAAVMGLLCNLSLEASIQQQLAGESQVLDTLLASCCGSSAASSAASTHPMKAGPQLPARKHQRTQQQTSQFDGTEAAETQLLQQQRAACLLSRAAKQAACIKALQDKDALTKLVAAIDKYLQQPLRTTALTEQQGQAQQAGMECHTHSTAWLEAMLRIIALLTAHPGSCSSCTPMQTTVAVRVCLALLQSLEVGDSTKGNAALVLGHFAGETHWHDQLRKADAVKVLVDVAYAGKGSATSKNAAIALAKMAKDGHMLDRLRELHGLEIIYQYVQV